MDGTKVTNVYCDQTTDGGGWTVIQRRVDGSTKFNRNWSDYKYGFGNNSNEFYFGNNTLSILGKTKGSELRVDMEDCNGNRAYAKYSSFKVDDESLKYQLHVSGYTSDHAGDSLNWHNGQKFSTYDQDNDNDSDGSCANKYFGGWWFFDCHDSNLNGEYVKYNQIYPGYARGVIWRHWTGFRSSLKFVEMKVRRNV